MNKIQLKKNKVRQSRSLRVRKKLKGSLARPRLCVVKTNKHILIQLINDEEGKTLASTSSCSKEFQNTEFCKKNKATAEKLGTKIAQLANELNIKEAVFDRGPFKYHGILATVADAARSAGLQF